MRNLTGHYSWIRLIILGILGMYIIYNIPFITNISLDSESWQSLFTLQDGLDVPILRSLLLALVQAIFLVFFSLLITILLFQINLLSSESKYLGILLIPVVLGNVSVAFLFKLLLLDSYWAFTSPFSKFLSLTYIQFWQYGSLFIYLFWLNQQTITQSTWDYAHAVKLNDYEKIKDILIPKQRNLSLLLFIVAFIFCYYEDCKMQFIFKASRGTDTELVNQWLIRTYQSDTLLNANIAFSYLSQAAFYVLIVALIILILSLFILRKFIVFWTKQRSTFNSKLLPPIWMSRLVCILLLFWVITPIAFGFYTQRVSLQLNIRALMPTLALTTIAALLSTILAVFFSMMSRLAWQKILSNFNFSSMFFLVTLFSLILVPPITLLVLGCKWM